MANMDTNGSNNTPDSPLSPRSRLVEHPMGNPSPIGLSLRSYQDSAPPSSSHSQSDFALGDDTSVDFARVARSSHGSSVPTQLFGESLESSLGWEPEISCLFERRQSRSKDGRTRAHTLPKLSVIDSSMPTASTLKSASFGGMRCNSDGQTSSYGWNERGELVDMESGKTYSIAEELLKVQSPNEEDYTAIVTASSTFSLPSAPAVMQQPEFSPYERVDLANEIMASYHKHIKPGKMIDTEVERSDTSARRYSDESDSGPSNSQRKSNLYKTELCRSWEEKGSCRYGPKCQFAHSAAELRPVTRHPKYKTEICKTFWESGTCPYGKRCVFIHTSTPAASDEKQGNIPAAATTLAGDLSPGITIMTKREPDIIAPRGRRSSNDFSGVGIKNVGGSGSKVSSYVTGLTVPRSNSEIDLIAYQRAVNERMNREGDDSDDWEKVFRGMQETAPTNLPPRLAPTSGQSLTSHLTAAGARLGHCSQYKVPMSPQSHLPLAANFLSLDLLGEMLSESSSGPARQTTSRQTPPATSERNMSDCYSYYEQRADRRLPPPIGAERGERFDWPGERRC